MDFSHLKTDIMENKYYTPTIEEFCPGFIYECTVPGDEKWIEYTFFPLNDERTKKLFPGDVYLKLQALLDKGLLRVKYLDREDIKAEGWVQINKSLYKIGEWKLVYEKGDTLISIFCGEEDCRFFHAIKNKSELKRLMTWLNITKEI